MSMTDEQNSVDYERQRSLAEIERLRPLDDDLMRELFRNCKELAELVLRIITEKPDLAVMEVHTQYDLKRLAGARSICLDVLATDSEGQIYNLEIQRSDTGAHAARARYHSSAIDVEHLKKGQDFTKLPITYVIFITEDDVWGKGECAYHFEWYSKKSELYLNDGAHIIYVNGAYNKEGDTSDLARLMHDFRCTKSEDMNFGLLAERTKYFKETPEGVSYMCKIIEDRVNETAKKAKYEQSVSIAVRMISKGLLSFEDIAEYSSLTIDEVKALAEKTKPVTA